MIMFMIPACAASSHAFLFAEEGFYLEMRRKLCTVQEEEEKQAEKDEEDKKEEVVLE